MSKTFAAVLFAILVCAGSADARVAGAAHPHKYLPHCAQGMVSASCTCHAGASGHYQVCRAGQYCHTFDGVCRQ